MKKLSKSLKRKWANISTLNVNSELFGLYQYTLLSVGCCPCIIKTTNKKSKLKNCLETLNKELVKKHDFTIDAKNPEYYREISKQYSTHKDLMGCYQHNPSLTSFVVEIESKKIVVVLEDEW